MRTSAVSPAGSPKVSVIITCCNGRPWIARAVDSVLSQTYQDFEIIVVDDASSDGSRDALDRFLDHPSFRLSSNPSRSGIPATKNTGLRLARGQYIAFLEQDDEWLPHKLSEQVCVLDSQPEVAMVAGCAVVVDAKGREWIQRRPRTIPLEPRETRIKALYSRNLVTSMSSVMLRRDCLTALAGFDETYSGADDYDFWLRLADFHRIVRLRLPLIRFRLHRKSYSSTHAERMLDELTMILNQAVERNPFLEPLRPSRLARVQLLRVERALENGAPGFALRRAYGILRTYPRPGITYPIAVLLMAGPAGRLLLKWIRAALFRIRFKKLKPGTLNAVVAPQS